MELFWKIANCILPTISLKFFSIGGFLIFNGQFNFQKAPTKGSPKKRPKKLCYCQDPGQHWDYVNHHTDVERIREPKLFVLETIFC